jgi:protocatechuate 3,4-dioxygenase beta subunit
VRRAGQLPPPARRRRPGGRWLPRVGATRTDAQGRYRFRTIRPAPYPGRTPHIHVKLRHPTWGEWTSQWFVAGDPGNAQDFIYRRLSAAEQAEVDLSLQRASPGQGATWWAQRRITVG